MNPNDIEAREFTVAARGYDREEVDAFLRVVGAEVRRLQSALTDKKGPAPWGARNRAANGSLSEAGAEPPDGTDAPEAEGAPGVELEPVSAGAAEAPPSDPAETYRKVGDETARILVAAEQAAMEIKERGHRDAADLIAAAREEALAIFKAAKAERGGLEDEIRKLHEARSLLGTEMEDMRRRFEELVLRLRQPFDVRHPKPRSRELKRALSGTGPGGPAAPAPARSSSPAEQFFRSSPPPMVPGSLPFEQGADAAEEQGGDDPSLDPKGRKPKAKEPPVTVGAPASIDVASSGSPAPPKSVNGNGTRTPRPGLDPAAPAGSSVSGGPGTGTEVEATAPVAAEPESAAAAEVGSDAGDAAAAGTGTAGTTEEGIKAEGEEAPGLPPAPTDAQGALDWREAVLGEMPSNAARQLKRLLQEDQSDLLERLRSWRGAGSAADHMPPTEEQVARFVQGLDELLAAAFRAGRGAGGAQDWLEGSEPGPVVEALVTKQLVTPLRRDLLRLLGAPSQGSGSPSNGTATAASKRASDVYRVWKGVRTDLLGEGLVYAVFHQGLLDAVRGNGSAVGKEWVVSPDEGNCPREVCRSNASTGPVGPDASFPSGHLVPPAHGGCTCTLLLTRN